MKTITELQIEADDLFYQRKACRIGGMGFSEADAAYERAVEALYAHPDYSQYGHGPVCQECGLGAGHQPGCCTGGRGDQQPTGQ